MTAITNVVNRVLRSAGIAESTAGACTAPECEVICYWGQQATCCWDCYGNQTCRPNNDWPPKPCRIN